MPRQPSDAVGRDRTGHDLVHDRAGPAGHVVGRSTTAHAGSPAAPWPRRLRRPGVVPPRDAVAQLYQALGRATRADVLSAARVTPHALRHAAITLALDAGVPLHEVQDFAGHRDPRSTRRYDRARGRLDRHASYALAAHLG